MMLVLSVFTSCFIVDPPISGERTKIRIGYMAGPTGMGMAKLIHDNGGVDGNENYVFTKYADTAAAKNDLASGKIDIICLPTNEAALYSSKVDTTAQVLAINCLNSLYFITDANSDVDELKDLEGQTVYTCKNGTPRTILEHIIKELELNITVSYEIDGKEILTPADLSAQVIAGNLPNAVMPEPLVTSSLLKINSTFAQTGIKWAVKADLADSWNSIYSTPITMGCVLASGDFASKNQYSINLFLDEYKASVEFISNPDNIASAADYVVETGIMAAAGPAKTALANLGKAIAYIDGSNMKTTLVAFYQAIGIALPSDSFYYE